MSLTNSILINAVTYTAANNWVHPYMVILVFGMLVM